jgi:uncharacterized protein YbjQ (UPF0145 family)
MIEIGVTLTLLIIGVIFGTRAQNRHLQELNMREDAMSHIRVTNLKRPPITSGEIMMVSGSTVVAFDYFRRFIARIVMLVGGRITMFEDMLDRARREALVRMLEQADSLGAREVHNVRFEFSRVGGNVQNQVGGGAELLAYGTAVK